MATTGTTDKRTALLIDLDGVIYQSDRVIVGAVEALEWIRQRKIPFLFVTNTTSRSRAALLDKFAALGFGAAKDEIVTPIVAARQWLQRAMLLVSDSAREDFGDIDAVDADGNDDVDAVVVGDLGARWDYALLNQTFRVLMREPQPELIALGMTRYWRGADGLNLDVAPFIRALEHAASCEARVIGKPAPAFFESALALLGARAEQTLMIGDDIVGDVGAAQACGIRGIQVRTGKFRAADLDGDIHPDAVLDSFADLPGWLRAD